MKVMAKDLIRTRHSVTKFYGLKSQLQGVSLRVQVPSLSVGRMGLSPSVLASRTADALEHMQLRSGCRMAQWAHVNVGSCVAFLRQRCADGRVFPDSRRR
jgi:hypothetical protein